MYLNSERVVAIEHYLSGYAGARIDLGFPGYTDAEAGLLPDFTLALEIGLGLERDTRMNWADYIERMDSSPRNIHTFFDEFARFLNGRGISLESDVIWPPRAT